MIGSLGDIPAVAEYLRRIGAEPRSLRAAVIKKKAQLGYWKDIAKITLTKAGEITAPEAYKPTDQEAADIKAAHDLVTWPSNIPAISTANLPVESPEDSNPTLFIFRNRHGEILLVQQRIETPEGKVYVPWSFWSDGIWRNIEPDGLLPLFGIDGLGNHTTIFIHEGAKAARHMRWMTEAGSIEAAAALAAHPWRDEIVGAAHIGWIGGALNPSRTDWGPVGGAGITRAYIVSDNDAPGRKVVPKIAHELQCVTFHVQFTQDWPASFDMADEWPKSMFIEDDGKTFYKGPSFRSCLHPATWATDTIVVNKKSVPVLREHFTDLWTFVEEAEIFVNKELPSIQRSGETLNAMLAAFSHASNTTALILKSYSGRTPRLIYRPSNRNIVVSEGSTSAINLHVRPNIDPAPGSAQEWAEFLEYMFPDEGERYEVARWCATLIARPDIRMTYGMLLVSVTQGVGKTTLAADILAPLVGRDNVSWPSENDIVNSAFNSWQANKRLIVASEIYTGHSWKAYNKLKSIITDDNVEVNEKFRKTYLTENWAHVLASSNSPVALRLEVDDRRWFYPRVTERPWPRDRFAQFRKWLERGGLNIILRWAKEFNNYVAKGAHPPSTASKQELIEESYSVPMREAAALAAAIKSLPQAAAMSMIDITFHISKSTNERVYETPLEIRRAMMRDGLKLYPNQVKIGSRKTYVLMNTSLADAVASLVDEPSKLALISAKVISPNSLLETPM